MYTTYKIYKTGQWKIHKKLHSSKKTTNLLETDVFLTVF